MKRFRPSMRDNYRYILLESVPLAVHPNPRDIYYTITDAITALYGDALAGTVACVIPYCMDRYVVVRCTRGYEDMVMTGIDTVYSYAGSPVALHPVCVSGTIRTLKELIERRMRYNKRYEMYVLDIGEETYPVQTGSALNRDLVTEEEKSIKRMNPTFLTTDDIGDNYDE